jgi:hypothetical protein
LGGNGPNSAELYSPEGKCNQFVAESPIRALNLDIILSYLNERIFACGGYDNKDCWQYHVASNSWSLYTTAKYTHNLQPGAIYNNMLYIVDELNPEIYDPTANIWSAWTAPPISTGDGPCMVTAGDTFVLIGGYTRRKSVQVYSHATKSWKVMTPEIPAETEIFYSGCILLPNGEDILIVGSGYVLFWEAVSLYNIKSNTFRRLPDVAFDRAASKLVGFGERIFAVDGQGGSSVEEFFHATNTWTHDAVDLKEWRKGYFGSVVLPASIFANIPGGCTGATGEGTNVL